MHALNTYIVEDSPVIRESLIATLEELLPVSVMGYAESETRAVRWLREPGHRADLVIVDIFLKDGSGLGVLREAQALSSHGHFVMLTNFATRDMRRRCLALGADQVFDKSNEIDALIAYCARLADGKRLRALPAAPC
jgi:DNA-binding NarL/FixJ family response regulator